jgi:carbonic anhydrase
MANQKICSIVQDLIKGNKSYIKDINEKLKKHISGQHPKIAVLSCSDSRVIPEKIFDKNLGDLFIVRVAGNVAMDPSVIESLEYCVNFLGINLFIILGHTHCGAIQAAEKTRDNSANILNEIKKGFTYDDNHIIGNIKRQLDELPKRSSIIKKAIERDKLYINGAVYNVEDGKVSFLNID